MGLVLTHNVGIFNVIFNYVVNGEQHKALRQHMKRNWGETFWSSTSSVLSTVTTSSSFLNGHVLIKLAFVAFFLHDWKWICRCDACAASLSTAVDSVAKWRMRNVRDYHPLKDYRPVATNTAHSTIPLNVIACSDNTKEVRTPSSFDFWLIFPLC